MKTRTSLVSNSSSTSFIVSAEQKEKAKTFGLELVSVKELKDCYQRLQQLDVGFITDDMYQLKHILVLPDDSFISKPFDRDYAYELGIDYPPFETDI